MSRGEANRFTLFLCGVFAVIGIFGIVRGINAHEEANDIKQATEALRLSLYEREAAQQRAAAVVGDDLREFSENLVALLNTKMLVRDARFEASALSTLFTEEAVKQKALRTELARLQQLESELDAAIAANAPPPLGVCQAVRMTVSAFSSSPDETWGDPYTTATGTTTQRGTIAVDPSVIPLWTESGETKNIFVPGYGWGTAEDTGGAVEGMHVDVWMPTKLEAKQWGIPHKDVSIC